MLYSALFSTMDTNEQKKSKIKKKNKETGQNVYMDG